MTLYEALSNFQDLYTASLSSSSRRVSDPIATDWQKISNEYDLYFQAYGEDNLAAAAIHLQNILDILDANGFIVDESVRVPLPTSINIYPNTIIIPCDSDGVPLSYAQAYSDIVVREGDLDQTSEWGFAITGTTGCTAGVVDNRISITNISADQASVDVDATRTGHTTQSLVIYAMKLRQGADGTGAVDDVTLGINGSSQYYVKDGGIDTTQLANDSVDSTKIDAGAVDSTALGDNAVIAGKIDSSALDGTTIQLNGSNELETIYNPVSSIYSFGANTEHTVGKYNMCGTVTGSLGTVNYLTLNGGALGIDIWPSPTTPGNYSWYNTRIKGEILFTVSEDYGTPEVDFVSRGATQVLEVDCIINVTVQYNYVGYGYSNLYGALEFSYVGGSLDYSPITTAELYFDYVLLGDFSLRIKVESEGPQLYATGNLDIITFGYEYTP